MSTYLWRWQFNDSTYYGNIKLSLMVFLVIFVSFHYWAYLVWYFLRSILCILISYYVVFFTSLNTVEPRCLEVPGTYNLSSSHPNFEAPESVFSECLYWNIICHKNANMRSYNTIQLCMYFYAVKIQTKT